MAALEPVMSDFPAKNAIAVTPNDSTDLSVRSRAIYVGTGGDLAVVMSGGGNTVVFPGVPSGALLPIAVTRVMATSTTATGIVALW